MGLSEAQERERSEYLDKNLKITECSQRKPYVFVSYASDNWETVFKTAVIPMQKQYGLSVYVDKAFEKGSDKWIVPMLRNVRGADAVVAFVSQSYIESYACFLELLTAVNTRTPVVFVSIEYNLHLGDTTDQPSIERGIKNEILNQGANIATNTNNTSNDIMRAMKSAYTSISTLLEQDALSKYDISDAFINFFRDASVNRKTINDLTAVRGTIASVSERVFDTSLIEMLEPESVAEIAEAVESAEDAEDAESVAEAGITESAEAISEAGTEAYAEAAKDAESAAKTENMAETEAASAETITQAESVTIPHTQQQYAQQQHTAPQQYAQQQYIPQPMPPEYAPQQQYAQQQYIPQPMPPEYAPQPKSGKKAAKPKKGLIGAMAAIVLIAIIGVASVLVFGGRTVTDKPYATTMVISGYDSEISGTYTGEWDKSNSQPNGSGTFVFDWENESGSGSASYEGEWADGLPDGQGTVKWKDAGTYTGEWKAGLFDGKGKFTYPNGTIYEGEYKKDKENGQFKVTYKDGTVYEVGFVDGYEHGKGTITYPDGTVQHVEFNQGKLVVTDQEYTTPAGYTGLYTGEWDYSNKRPQGQGKMKYDNGTVYNGGWNEGVPNGQGIVAWTDDSGTNTYEGEVADGKFNGTGKCTYGDGRIYEGEWKDGKKHGKGVYTWSDGKHWDGEFKDGEFYGVGICTFPDGKQAKFKFENGEWIEVK